MQQVFVEEKLNIGQRLTIAGADGHHLASVVRMQVGEKIRISGVEGESFLAEVVFVGKDLIEASLLEETTDTELATKVYLFQALIKGERMETIVEKAVELGAFEVIPVAMTNCVVKLDDKKSASKIKRYQAIAEAAAKQCKRSILPEVKGVMTLAQALDYASANCQLTLLPYECAEGMEATKEALAQVQQAQSVAIFIGPEGGFTLSEVDAAKAKDAQIISLGKRILRADTAAITAVGMVMMEIEKRIAD